MTQPSSTSPGLSGKEPFLADLEDEEDRERAGEAGLETVGVIRPGIVEDEPESDFSLELSLRILLEANSSSSSFFLCFSCNSFSTRCNSVMLE
mgnify:CR=1 FL=1